MEIATKDVKMNLGGTPILKGINTHIKNKEFVGIIGPNGCGKSTFLKAVYRVLKPDNGCIYISNQPLEEMTYKETAKKMAVVSQHNYYKFDFTVREMVLMGRSPYKKNMQRDTKEDYDIVDECLEKVGMSSYINRVFSSLSGGEQQRIILARALAQKTESMILDEPTNHLDIKYQLQILDTVKDLGITVISAFHDLNIAAMYCDKIYALQAGEVVSYGTPQEVITTELIHNLYEVESTVNRNEDGILHVIFHPTRSKGESR